MAESLQPATAMIQQMQKQWAEQTQHLTPVIQQIQEQTSESIGKMAAAIQGIADASMTGLHGGLYESQTLIADMALEDARHDSEVETRHIRLEEAIIDQLNIITRRLDMLENKSVQPYPQLEDMRKQLSDLNQFVERHKQNLEDLQIWKESNIRERIHELDKKEGSHDGR